MIDKIILLVRHAEPVRRDEKKRYLGQSNPGLSTMGVQQAEQLARTLKHYSIRSIFSSDLRRAEQTAGKIGEVLDCLPKQIQELREVNLGEWEGKTFAEIRNLYAEEFNSRGKDMANHRPPGGESFTDLGKRVIPAFEHIVRQAERDIVIVAHAGVNRVIICHLLKIPVRNLFTIKQDYAGVNIVIKSREGYSVLGINENFCNGKNIELRGKKGDRLRGYLSNVTE